MLKLLMDPIVFLFAGGSLAILAAIYAGAYWLTRHYRAAEWTAIRLAFIASWLSLFVWTVDVVHAISVSKRSTGILGIVEIPFVGVPLAVVVFFVAWAAVVVVLSLRASGARGRPRRWWLVVAWAIVVATGALSAAYAWSEHLQNRARIETSPDSLRELYARWWTSHDAGVLDAMAGNERTPPDVLSELARHKKSQVRYDVAKNPSTPGPVLEQLYAEDQNRYALAVNPSVPEAMLRRLAENADHLVRFNLASNLSVPRDLLERLMADPNEMVATAARRASRTRDGSTR